MNNQPSPHQPETELEQSEPTKTLGPPADRAFTRYACQSLTDFHQAAQALFTEARLLCYILTPDLEPDRWNNADLASQLVQQLNRQSRLMTRILVTSSSRIAPQHHALVALAQRLPSRVQLRQVADDTLPHWRMVLVDYRHRLQLDERLQGYLNWNDIPYAKQYSEEADRSWERARPVAELRQLIL